MYTFSRQRIQAGFTLLELMIVIFIIALISFMAAPTLLDPSGYNLKSAARRLSSISGYLQAQAAAKKMYLRLNLDLKTGKYWVSTVDDEGEDELVPFRLAEPEFLPRGVSFMDVEKPYEGKKTEGEAAIQFFPSGYNDGATIHLKDSGKGVYSVVINQITGRAKLYDEYIQKEMEEAIRR